MDVIHMIYKMNDRQSSKVVRKIYGWHHVNPIHHKNHSQEFKVTIAVGITSSHSEQSS